MCFDKKTGQVGLIPVETNVDGVVVAWSVESEGEVYMCVWYPSQLFLNSHSWQQAKKSIFGHFMTWEMMKITWAHTFAAHKMVFFMALPVPPFFIMTKILQAITLSWWISPSTSPICELPDCAIRPLPNILLYFVSASDPQCVVLFYPSLGPFSQNVAVCWMWGHGR